MAFGKKGHTAISDIQVTDTGAKSYCNTDPRKVLESAAKKKKKKYEEACLEPRWDFTPMVY